MQCSVSFFCPPFQRLWSCSLYFVPQSARTTTTFIKPKQEQSFHRSLRSCLTSFTHSFLHLPCPQKNYTAQQKHTPALRFQRRLSEPSLQIAHSFLISLFSFRLSLPATFVPLAIGSRLSLRQAGKALHFVSLLSHLPSFGSGLLYLLGFPLRPRTAPDHPPLKKEEAQLYYSPIRLIFLFRS